MSRFSANFYSKNKQIGTHIYPNDTDYLFSDRRYKTKITADDLPLWYMKGLFYAYIPGFLKAKNVSELYYYPSFSTNHMFKDDFLYIKYEPSSRPKERFNFLGNSYDEFVWGYNIPIFLIFAEHYSHYDTSAIWQQIEEKRQWFAKTYQNDYSREVGVDDPTQTFCDWAHLVYSGELK